MRGVGAVLFIIVVTLLLRSTALTALASRGVVLDVLVFATVLWALGNGEGSGCTFGFALGLAADLDAAHWMGRHALVLCLIGYAVGRLSHTLVRDSSRTQLVLLLAATLIHQTWVASFELGGFGAWPYLVRRVLLAAVATAPIGMVIIALVRRGSGRSLFAHASAEPDPTG
jgi:rod shape-determining protein MreD